MGKLIIYHGSSEIIEKPIKEKGKTNNDYGNGFYCTEHLELAKEWACTSGKDGYANCYELDTDGLRILDLSEKRYSILHWLAVLVEHRVFRISSPIMKQGVAWLKEYFYIDVNDYDIVIGYRADDSYFSFTRAFLSNEISLEQLQYAMKLGGLGNQIVLKSSKAFEKITFLSYEVADNQEYYMRRKVRDSKARKSYVEERDKEELGSIFMRDILQEEIKADDPRIQ